MASNLPPIIPGAVSQPPIGTPATPTGSQQQRTGLTFSPMLVVMPDTTHQMLFRYRLRRHSTHNPRGAISRISDLFLFPVHFSRRTHPTRDHVIHQLVMALQQMAVTPPYNDPRFWLFQVTAEISNKMPMLRDAPFSEHWPYIPVTLNQGKFTVDVLCRCGPPPLDTMVKWLHGSNKMGRAHTLLADYSVLYEEERRLDETSERKYILSEKEVADVLAGSVELSTAATTSTSTSAAIAGPGDTSQSPLKRPLTHDQSTESAGDNEKKPKIKMEEEQTVMDTDTTI